jgi:hypothetical protein
MSVTRGIPSKLEQTQYIGIWLNFWPTKPPRCRLIMNKSRLELTKTVRHKGLRAYHVPKQSDYTDSQAIISQAD